MHKPGSDVHELLRLEAAGDLCHRFLVHAYVLGTGRIADRRGGWLNGISRRGGILNRRFARMSVWRGERWGFPCRDWRFLDRERCPSCSRIVTNRFSHDSITFFAIPTGVASARSQSPSLTVRLTVLPLKTTSTNPIRYLKHAKGLALSFPYHPDHKGQPVL